jgi:hypothetical protein
VVNAFEVGCIFGIKIENKRVKRHGIVPKFN